MARSPVEHYAAIQEASEDALRKQLAGLSKRLADAAKHERISTGSIRMDLREAEVYLLAVDRARDAASASKATAEGIR